MAITVRPADVADTEKCGDILYRAFQTIAENHNFPCDVPSVEAATGMLAMLVADPGFYGIAAEHDGQIAGSSFADQRSRIAGIGPISVDPEAQNQGVGRTLTQAVVDHFTARDFPGIRLVQTAYHNRSLCLYTTIGFQTREPLSVLQGPPLNIKFVGHDVRPATEADVPACNLLARRVHGFDRGVELSEAIAAKTAMVVERLAQITGYASDVGFAGHAVAETNQDLKVLIGAAPAFPGPGFLLPTRNHDVFAWCLENRLRLVMQMTLMTIGLYNEPSGACCRRSGYEAMTNPLVPWELALLHRAPAAAPKLGYRSSRALTHGPLL